MSMDTREERVAYKIGSAVGWAIQVTIAALVILGLVELVRWVA